MRVCVCVLKGARLIVINKLQLGGGISLQLVAHRLQLAKAGITKHDTPDRHAQSFELNLSTHSA